jgi:hypothetical protein
VEHLDRLLVRKQQASVTGSATRCVGLPQGRFAGRNSLLCLLYAAKLGNAKSKLVASGP